MRLSVIAAVIAASSSVATAGTYLGAGIGTSASIGDQAFGYTPDGRSGRLILGFGFGRIGVEANATRYGLMNVDKPYDATSLAAALRVSLPLGNNFEVFGRGGLQRTWLTNNANMTEPSGNGWLLGAGAAYDLDLGITGASIFVDYTFNQTAFSYTTARGQSGSFNQNAGMWTLGLTVSI